MKAIKISLILIVLLQSYIVAACTGCSDVVVSDTSDQPSCHNTAKQTDNNSNDSECPACDLELCDQLYNNSSSSSETVINKSLTVISFGNKTYQLVSLTAISYDSLDLQHNSIAYSPHHKNWQAYYSIFLN